MIKRLRHWGVAASIAAAIVVAAAVWPARSPADEIEGPFPVEIRARPISDFRIGSADRQFGQLEFVGGLEMNGSSRHFGASSAFRFLKPGSDFIGVADTGFWFFGTIERDAQGKPVGVDNFSMAQMVDESGKLISEKWEVDAEGLDVEGDIATVGFERNHRIAQFKIDPAGMKGPIRTLDFVVPKRELRRNRGFETVTRADPQGQHAGGLVVVSEKSLDDRGNILAAVIEGPNKGPFTVKRDGEFSITDGAFLPNGDLLLLERSFSMGAGVKMRLRRIYGESIAKDAVADGPVLLEADMSFQIDNMEAMDVWTRQDGALMVSLMSDDNHSILQRNLYLEFRLHED
ncbi:esterase-like activity of phytase family protein [Arvimicrobium flavum]|uniref:esterase-like activity of phytase family protein n=1 Tax=Arvimicrobium flavum TaxID=3393320 RepID=UPI00237C1050|nr:esterase-like activity of phytase family protein [Mesorhizobium shangrilense]